MGKVNKGNRKHSIIDRLDPALKETVHQMMMNHIIYEDIAKYLGEQGVSISVSSVCRYAINFNANMQQLKMANENFRMMMDELEKYPDLDITQGIATLASQNVLNALANMPEERWRDLDPESLLRQANGIVRAVAYKKRGDVQNQKDYEAGFEAAKTILFGVLRKERPDLYFELAGHLNRKKKEGEV